MAGLKFKHIYKVYPGGVRAVNDFDLEFKDKSFVVLVGPSGCGKSTTLRMIAGLESITSGQLYIDNVLVNDVESKNRDIAMVFQSYALYPHMSVYQNMGFSLKLRHEKPKVIREKVLRAAEILEISDLLDRKPKELSGGQRQRVALGRAIVRDANVFLLDEPLSNLDAKLRVQMRTEITKLHDKLQTTFVYVTHDQTEAMTMGDMIVVMNKGFIQQADAPVTLFEDPANLFVATFLGSPQMNIIESELVEDGDKVGVKLEGVEGNVVWLRKETSKQIRNSNIPFDKPYLFGVRPDHISLSDKGIPAHVEAVEQLGDETITYVTIEGHKGNVVIKSPLNVSVAVNDDVYLDFSVERVYLFDKESEHSLIGMPSYNKIPCRVEGNEVHIGKNTVLTLDDEYVSHLLDSAFDVDRFLAIKPEHIQFQPLMDENTELDVKVEFIEERTNYNIIYSTIEGVDPYLIFRASKDRKIKAGEKLTIYLPLEHIDIYDENDDAHNSRECVFPNVAKAVVKTKEGKSTIAIVGGQTLVYDDLGVQDGVYEFKLRQDRVEPVFTRKLAKDLEEEVLTSAAPGQVLTVSCYDEEPQHKLNTIFVKINGFKEYVTILIKNNFSVYKMPKFKVVVPADGFELNPWVEPEPEMPVEEPSEEQLETIVEEQEEAVEAHTEEVTVEEEILNSEMMEEVIDNKE